MACKQQVYDLFMIVAAAQNSSARVFSVSLGRVLLDANLRARRRSRVRPGDHFRIAL